MRLLIVLPAIIQRGECSRNFSDLTVGYPKGDVQETRGNPTIGDRLAGLL